MSLQDFKTIVEDVGYAKELYPFGGGEPLLHPDFDKMISLACLHAPFVGLTSNGMLLDKDKTERLNSSGLSELTVSVDSPYVKEYAMIRVGGDLNKVKNNLAYFTSHSSIPLRIHTVLSATNQASVPAIPQLAYDLGAKKLTFNILHPPFGFAHLMPNPLFLLYAVEILKRECEKLKLNLMFQDMNEMVLDSCKTPTFTCFIDSEGYMAPCCVYPTMRLGNVLSEGFATCWNNKQMQQFRRCVLRGEFSRWCKTFCLPANNLIASD